MKEYLVIYEQADDGDALAVCRGGTIQKRERRERLEGQRVHRGTTCRITCDGCSRSWNTV